MSAPASSAPLASAGLLSALRAMGGTLNEIFRIRGALFAVELGAEIERRKRLAIFAALAFAFLHTALLLLTLFVTVMFWDTHRLAATGAMVVLYLGLGAAAIMRFRTESEASPPPFAASLGELERDLGDLRAPR
jgi:uncharacterized membrane protein YqjE